MYRAHQQAVQWLQSLPGTAAMGHHQHFDVYCDGCDGCMWLAYLQVWGGLWGVFKQSV